MIPTKLLLFVAIAVVYFLGAYCIPIMDIDAAQYASISQEMAQNNEFLQVQYRGEDYYLDKPPLLFWLSALFFKIFGVSQFVYRLWPIFTTFLGIYALYRLAKLYYSEQTAYISALVMGSCQAYFLMNHDVRCDTLLANCTIVAIWQIAAFVLNKNWLNLIIGFAFVGLSMLAKGPIGPIVVGIALFIDFVLKRQWANIFKWEWLVGLAITALVISPYCIGLYKQYGEEGLYFYFWKQSFGRITGENEWDNSPGLFFQAQNFLWGFLPWVVPFAVGFYQQLKSLFLQKFKLNATQEGMSLGGFIIPFAALSTSHYQLPHYTYVVFPLAALITGRHFSELIEKNQPSKWLKNTLLVISALIWVLIIILSTWAFPLTNFIIIASLVAVALLSYRLFQSQKVLLSQLVFAPFLTVLGANLALNTHVYPSLMAYQTGSVLGEELAESKTDLSNFYLYDLNPSDRFYLFFNTIDFYTQHITPILSSEKAIEEQLKKQPNLLIYTDELGIESFKKLNLNYKIEKTYDKFHVTGLTLPFLNPATRLKETNKVFLVKVG